MYIYICEFGFFVCCVLCVCTYIHIYIYIYVSDATTPTKVQREGPNMPNRQEPEAGCIRRNRHEPELAQNSQKTKGTRTVWLRTGRNR